jgi:hypothetical protein
VLLGTSRRPQRLRLAAKRTRRQLGATLEKACDDFGVEHGKERPARHGIVTDKYIRYNRRDVLATSELAVIAFQSSMSFQITTVPGIKGRGQEWSQAEYRSLSHRLNSHRLNGTEPHYRTLDFVRSLGCSRFSRRCHLFSDLSSISSMEVGQAINAVTETRRGDLKFPFRTPSLCLHYAAAGTN